MSRKDGKADLTRAERRALEAKRLSARLARKAINKARYLRQFARRNPHE
jgi:hypothetical protein